MSEVKRKPLEFTIKKKIARKLSLASMSSLSSPSVLKGHLKKNDDVVECDDKGDAFIRARDNVKDKYNLDLGTLTQQIEKELSSSSSNPGDATCWTPEAILNLIDGLRVPLELIVHIIQAVKSALK